MKIIKANIIGIKQETPTVKIITLKPREKIDFIPGQFLNLIVENPKKIIRSYSIASKPNKKEIEFIIRSTPTGDMTFHLENHLKKGDEVKLTGPFGLFKLKKAKEYLFIAGGSGIAPIISMMRSLKNNYTLIYSERTKNEIICYKELKNSIITLTRDSWKGRMGRINKQLIKENLNSNPIVYICGLPDFVNQMKKIVRDLNVNPERINIEKY